MDPILQDSDLTLKPVPAPFKVGVVGLGYVGLPTAVAAAQVGNSVIGFDVNSSLVASLNAHRSSTPDVTNTELADLCGRGLFSATTNLARLNEVDFVLLCIPTPINHSRLPDLSSVTEATSAVAKTLRFGQTVILESTTYPGTTEEVVLPILTRTGLVVGNDFHLAFAPERLEPGNSRYLMAEIPKIIGGCTAACTQAAAGFYRTFIHTVVPVSSPRVAEAAKMHENAFRLINISYVNEFAEVLRRSGIDVGEVIKAAQTKPFGFMPFWPGPGVGGHCIPVDPYYLLHWAKGNGMSIRSLEAASHINEEMPALVVARVMEALNEQGKCLRGATVYTLGITYKKDVGDVRETPASLILTELRRRGATVCFHDPYVRAFTLQDGTTLLRSPLTVEAISDADCCLILTDHTEYDWSMVAESKTLLVDTRNVIKS